MRERIAAMRTGSVAQLAAAGANRDFGFIARQHGMELLLPRPDANPDHLPARRVRGLHARQQPHQHRRPRPPQPPPLRPRRRQRLARLRAARGTPRRHHLNDSTTESRWLGLAAVRQLSWWSHASTSGQEVRRVPSALRPTLDRSNQWAAANGGSIARRLRLRTATQRSARRALISPSSMLPISLLHLRRSCRRATRRWR